MFEHFRLAGVEYLAISRGNAWHVIDRDGNNYGSWQTVDNFKKSASGKAIIAGGMRAMIPVSI